jgi:hypothetical protein
MCRFLYELFKRKEKVYCQDENCRKEITREGGFVSSDGEIYCFKTDMRIFQPRSMKDTTFYVEFETAKEVQKEIKKGKLVHFGKLETFFNGKVNNLNL